MIRSTAHRDTLYRGLSGSKAMHVNVYLNCTLTNNHHASNVVHFQNVLSSRPRQIVTVALSAPRSSARSIAMPHSSSTHGQPGCETLTCNVCMCVAPQRANKGYQVTRYPAKGLGRHGFGTQWARYGVVLSPYRRRAERCLPLQ